VRSLSSIAVIFTALLLSQTDSFTSARLTRASLSGTSLKSQSGDRQIHGVKAEGIISAVVDFQDLARQAQLRPQVGQPVLEAAPEVRKVKKIGTSAMRAEPPNPATPVDLPRTGVPSQGAAVNFAGLDDIPRAGTTTEFVIPPDTTGAVSPNSINRILTTLNNNYRVQDKTGAQIGSDVSIRDFWAAVGANKPFDPNVEYDPYNDRWILTAASDSQTADTSILVGVSQTSDPAGNYFLFKVPARIGTDPPDVNNADFPMLGFNKNWLAVSIIMLNSTTGGSDGRALVIDYPTFRTGTLVNTYFTGISLGGDGYGDVHPATTYSSTQETEYLVVQVDGASATYMLHTITGTPANPIFTTGTLKTRPGGGWTDPALGEPNNILPQAQGTCTSAPLNIEGSDDSVSAVVFRNDSIWYAQTIGLPAGDVLTHTAVQWTQLNTSGDVIQGGRVDDPTATDTNGGKWYDFPSIAVNIQNDVVMGFSEFSSAQFASAGYAYRDHSDAAGTMRDPFIYKAGEDCYSKAKSNGRNRWGDFSHVVVDPTDDCAFWTIQEYAKLQAPPTVNGSNSKWGTWWAKVDAITTCAPTVVSRKTHGTAGDFDVNLPLTGTPGIECRSGGSTNDFTIVATFSGNVTVAGNPQAQVTSGMGAVGSGGASNGGMVTVNGSTVTIPLTNVANAQTINVTLNSVNGFTNVVIPMSVLAGDTTANGAVNSSDIAQTQSQSGQLVTMGNFREDVTVNGTINSSDIALVQSKSGTALPTSP
jgi:hypothetical protein